MCGIVFVNRGLLLSDIKHSQKWIGHAVLQTILFPPAYKENKYNQLITTCVFGWVFFKAFSLGFSLVAVRLL